MTDQVAEIEQAEPSLFDELEGMAENQSEEESSEEMTVFDELMVIAEGEPEKPEEVDKKVTDLTTKAEKEDLSKEEIKFLEDQGYEIKAEEAENDEPVAEEKPEKEEEKPKEDHKTAFDDFLSKAYPGQAFESREEKEARVLERINQDQEAHQNLIKIFEESPEVSDLVNYFMEHPNATIAQAVHEIGLDISAAPEPGKEGYKEYILAEERAKSQKEEAKKQQKINEENRIKSVEEANGFIKRNNMTEEMGRELFDSILRDVDNFSKNTISKEYMEMRQKAMNYDKDIVAAEAKGEVKGQNKKIIIQKKAKKGDKIPVLNGGASIQDSKVSEEMTMLQSSMGRRDNW
jgi:hypothetical protein